MKYLAIDIETTGLDPHNHQVIEFAGILDDLKDPPADPPRLHIICPSPQYVVTPATVLMHSDLWHILNNAIVGQTYFEDNILFTPPKNIDLAIALWLSTPDVPLDILADNIEHYTGHISKPRVFLTPHPLKITAAGKNVASFDLPFITGRYTRWSHRCIDVGTLYLSDDGIPSLEDLTGEAPHQAMADAESVVRLIRDWKAYMKANLKMCPDCGQLIINSICSKCNE